MKTSIVGSLLAAALTVPSAALAQLERAGVVTTLHGAATIVRASTSQAAPLKFKDDVFLHDRITTGDDSVARILLGGKALVTIRERSVVTITEMPGVSNVDVEIGNVAIAVVKERMQPGESVQIRTPNAVAGIRGTVVITEVSQATAQLGVSGGGFTTQITVLRGLIEVTRLDGSRRSVGSSVMVGALESIGISGGLPLPLAAPRGISRDVAEGLARTFKLKATDPASIVTPTMVQSHVEKAATLAPSTLAAPATTGARPAASPTTPGSASAAAATSTSNSGPSGSGSNSGPGSNNSGPSGHSGSSGHSGPSGGTAGPAAAAPPVVVPVLPATPVVNVSSTVDGIIDVATDQVKVTKNKKKKK